MPRATREQVFRWMVATGGGAKAAAAAHPGVTVDVVKGWLHRHGDPRKSASPPPPPPPPPKGRARRYPVGEVEAALLRAHGIVSVAAKILGCGRRTVDRYVARYPRLQATRDECRAELVDRAELGVIVAVGKGDVRACLAVLRAFSPPWRGAVKVEHAGVIRHRHDIVATLPDQEVFDLAEQALARTPPPLRLVDKKE